MLAPQEIRFAAREFPEATATLDSVHPRQFAEMSDAALATLALLFQDWEIGGECPATTQQVCTKLIPKPSGGRRPIGFFPAALRLRGKARVRHAKEWQNTVAADPAVNVQAGRNIGDSMWRSMLRAQCGVKEGSIALDMLWDINKCFEQVCPKLLWHLARELGYPLVLLRLSLRSYRWPRTLVMEEGLVAPPILAHQGIVAGSAMATFELTAYLLLALKSLKAKHPLSGLSLHIDDLMMMVQDSDPAEAAKRLVAPGKDAVELFEKGAPPSVCA